MAKEYVDQRNDGLYVAGTRVSLDSVVHAFLRGESPEGIVESFPALTLEQAFGSLAFYTANRETVDQYLRKGHAAFDALRTNWQQAHPDLYARLEEAKQRSHVSLP
jgi:uncharacterized protein (DUF433 family)